ncbi:MAG: hypothetical protein R3349_02870 [Geminicoccaceae bacterium]|nr:hypothetical protein [Geminicoccaceae bacterium]
MIVRVDCEPDRHGDPRPVRLHLDGRSIDLVQIHDVWPGADHTYVKAVDAGGTTWILRHDRPRNQWEVTLFERHPAPRGPTA